MQITEAQIDRRIEFLIREARFPDSLKDQTVVYAFRVITNYLSTGADSSSKALRAQCLYRSKAAHALSLKDPKGWLNLVTNEHQYPIKRAWQWMLDDPDSLTVSNVKKRLSTWPVVVVTKEESKRLRDDPTRTPEQRYSDAGIEVLHFADGTWKPVSGTGRKAAKCAG